MDTGWNIENVRCCILPNSGSDLLYPSEYQKSCASQM